MRRGSQGKQMRLQVARLLDYVPGPAVAPIATPIDIPYATCDLSTLSRLGQVNLKGSIHGIVGRIELEREMHGLSGRTEMRYQDFSIDGINYYSGYERSRYGFAQESYYEAPAALGLYTTRYASSSHVLTPIRPEPGEVAVRER